MTERRVEPVHPTSRRFEIFGRDLLVELDEFAVPASIAALTVVVVVIELIAGLASAASVIPVLIAGAVNTVCSYLILGQRRTNTVLSEITLSYIATGNRGLLDELLGRLITGRFRRQDFQPADQLFLTLRDVAQGSDYELKRRLVEALPALAEIDLTRTITLMHELRGDWDAGKWRGDLRRRTVEALVARAGGRSGYLLHRVPDEDLEDLLRLRDDDELWTGFATAEATQHWAAVLRGSGKFEQADKTMQGLHDGIARLQATSEERQTLERHSTAYELLIADDLAACLEIVEAYATNGTALQRTSAARLIGSATASKAAKANSVQILSIMAKLSQDPERNVRRPLARQESVGYILVQASTTSNGVAAVALLESLLRDEDDIIPLTTFDLIGSDGLPKDLRARAIDVARERGGPPALMERVGRAEAELVREST